MTHTPDADGDGDGVDDITVRANGLRHHVLHYPCDGPELLVAGGITTPALGSDFLAARLRDDHGYRVYVPDLRGRGDTDRAPSGRYRLADYAADLRALVTELGLRAPVLLGHSLGARVVAAAAPDIRYSALVLVDPPMSGPGRPYPTSAADFAAQLRQANRGTTPEEVAGWFPGWPRRELEIRARALPTCDPVAVAETHRGFETEEFTDYWPGLTGRVAVIRGARSPVVTAEDLRRLGELNPAASRHEVGEAGHMVPWDNLDGFLREFERATHPA